MKLHEIIDVHQEPYFRKMRVESGFMYNFYDTIADKYKEEWIFVQESSEMINKLKHHKTTTVGLWATDRPDLLDDPKKLLFEIK